MHDDLAGRHVVVTGARGGLGGAVVEILLAAGATCHLPQRGPATPIASDRAHVTGGIDLTNEADVVAYYKGLPPLWASIHLAGGYAGAPITETTLADLKKQLDQNFISAFLTSREAVRNLRAAKVPGRIVNVASRAALRPAGGALAYATSKAAVVMLTQGLAAEVRDDGITVNAIAPATIDTAANRAAMPGADTSRWAAPADIARVLLWLVSPATSLVSGAVIPV